MDWNNLKVKCISDYENHWGSCDQIKGNLTVGNIYTIENIEIHPWHTKIWLKEVPGKSFNSVYFEAVEDK